MSVIGNPIMVGGGPARSGIYGFYINGNEADPYSMVTYLEDAIGMTPAYMDFANQVFNWGSWGDAFFLPRPCMLKYDGTVDYYLDPDDYTKKLDGTASDVADTSYGGNAMMEWGRDGKKIWYKIVPGSGATSAYIYVADHQEDDGYMAWSFINADGEWIDHFYTPIFNGSVDNNSRMRSMSGLAVSKTLTADAERTHCKANGDGWDTEVYADIVLINILLTLITKTTDSQTAIGQGLSNDGSETVNDGFRTGVHNDKGLFWGTSSGAAATYTNAVKVFGMENWWGFQLRRFVGLVNANGTIKYKLTYGIEDGSTGTDYVISTTASAYNGYKTGASVPAANNAYINKMTFDTQQFTPTAASGTASTYFCDGLYTNNNQVDYATRGGRSGHGVSCGVWCLSLIDASSLAYWSIGATPSCKPILSEGGN